MFTEAPENMATQQRVAMPPSATRPRQGVTLGGPEARAAGAGNSL